MAKKTSGKMSDMLPLLAGAALIGGGLWLWKSGLVSGETEEDDQEIAAQLDKWVIANDFYDGMWAGGSPTVEDTNHYNMLVESIKAEELLIQEKNKERLARAMTDYYQSLGCWIVIPSVLGFMFTSALVYWSFFRKPPPPPNCPKCGTPTANESALRSHISSTHSVTMAALVEAQTYWVTQPLYVKSSIASLSGQYTTVSSPITSWGLSSLTSNISAMATAYTAVLATIAANQALATTMALCLI